MDDHVERGERYISYVGEGRVCLVQKRERGSFSLGILDGPEFCPFPP